MKQNNLKILLVSPLPPPAGGIASWTQQYIDWSEKNNLSVEIVNTAVIGKRAEKINQKTKILDEIKRTKPEIQEYSYSYLPNSKLPYLGNDYEIEIRNIDLSVEKIEKAEIKNNNKLIFYLKEIPTEYNQSESSLLYEISDIDIIKNRIKNLYEKWLYEQAQILFKEKIDKFSRIIDVPPKNLQIKKLKNRWGSITKNKKVVLNINLVKAPQNIIDYIIQHELCHFKIQGYSHHFWSFLKLFVPDYQTKKEWVDRNSKNIID